MTYVSPATPSVDSHISAAPVRRFRPGATGHTPKKLATFSRREATVGVYLPNSHAREPYRIAITYARELRLLGMGLFVNHAKDFRLNFTPQMIFRGASCSMSPRLMERAAMGNKVAIASVVSWLANHLAYRVPRVRG